MGDGGRASAAGMGQVTIYLDPVHEKLLRQAAQAAGLSVSRWLANLVAEKTRAEWPEEVQALAGAWEDFPDADDLRARRVRDRKRPRL